MARQHCPVCHTSLDKATPIESNLHCACGWSDVRITRLRQKSLEWEVAGKMIISSAVMLVLATGMIFSTTLEGKKQILTVKSLLDMDSSDEYVKLGEAYLDRGNLVMGTELLDQAEQKSGLGSEALWYLARLHMARGNFDRAIQLFERYIENGGQDVLVYFRLAEALDKAGYVDHAIQYYNMSLSDQPNMINVTAAKALFRLYVRTGHFAKAKQLLKTIRYNTNLQPGELEPEIAQLKEYT